jgi:hypothetical protein
LFLEIKARKAKAMGLFEMLNADDKNQWWWAASTHARRPELEREHRPARSYLIQRCTMLYGWYSEIYISDLDPFSTPLCL